MTLEEAIQRAEEVAKNNYSLADCYHSDEGVYLKQETNYRLRAEEHEQLASWLKELKGYREALNDIKRDLAERFMGGRSSFIYQCAIQECREIVGEHIDKIQESSL